MPAAVFLDVDHVLVKGQSQQSLLLFLFHKKQVSVFFFIKVIFILFFYKFGFKINLDSLREESMRQLQGWPESKALGLFEEFYTTVLSKRIFQGCVDLIKEHQKSGHEVVLVSASLHEIIERLRLEFSLKYQISTRLEINNGMYTGRMAGKVPYGAEKARRIKAFALLHGFDLNEAYAYSDHISDVEMLEAVRFARVVNPDQDLRKYAVQRAWPVYEFGSYYNSRKE